MGQAKNRKDAKRRRGEQMEDKLHRVCCAVVAFLMVVTIIPLACIVAREAYRNRGLPC